ncbi:hypothetical protein [Nocardia africana]|uniref:Beta-ketoadipyl-CoA thiolase n=1 Tax=Nocardia africana TaxID=134964 RepID=A0A378X0W3_9NOCA|nr:hypothetical protein [Nocardia africana]MCC3312374.1 hypothetical protein [Nocardia africana]SUA46314.1 Beta-ketoadipyl-CoA thiolase [Nocardia africana]
MTSVVLIDAGRSAVIPDDPDLPETPTGLTEDVIAALLRRTCLDRSEIAELFLSDPRCLSTGCTADQVGWVFDTPPLGLRTTVGTTSATSLAQAVRAIERDPEVVAVVAAADFGTGSWNGDGGAELQRRRHTARVVAAWWEITPDEMADWARSSYTRAAECAAAGDFAAEIVSTTPGYVDDCFRKPDAIDSFSGRAREGAGKAHGFVDEEAIITARCARGASAIILTSEANAVGLGLRFRARVRITPPVPASTEFGIAPLGTRAMNELLAPCGFDADGLDQLEVPEQCAVTPPAWIKETGISEYLVNPRGGDLAFGHLPRSGQLRSLVTMLNSLEDTGGRAGALVAADAHRTTAVLLTLADSIAPKGWKDTVSPAPPATVKKEKI